MHQDEEKARTWGVMTSVIRDRDPPKRVKVLANDEKPAFLPPALVTGAMLKDHQLEGVAWMVSLWEDGISGILGESLMVLYREVFC